VGRWEFLSGGFGRGVGLGVSGLYGVGLRWRSGGS